MVSYHLPFKKGAEKLEMVQKRVSKGFQSPEEIIKDAQIVQPFSLIERWTGLTLLQCRRCFSGKDTK